ncbi:hypothetical protein SNEBB_007525 [Seison nebaliae]|nr:hypothetical protein SNEBB_007525 [Seison nebaliae]
MDVEYIGVRFSNDDRQSCKGQKKEIIGKLKESTQSPKYEEQIKGKFVTAQIQPQSPNNSFGNSRISAVIEHALDQTENVNGRIHLKRKKSTLSLFDGDAEERTTKKKRHHLPFGWFGKASLSSILKKKECDFNGNFPVDYESNGADVNMTSEKDLNKSRNILPKDGEMYSKNVPKSFNIIIPISKYVFDEPKEIWLNLSNHTNRWTGRLYRFYEFNELKFKNVNFPKKEENFVERNKLKDNFCLENEETENKETKVVENVRGNEFGRSKRKKERDEVDNIIQKPIPLSQLFNKKSGWSCSACLVNNDVNSVKCVSCETPNPKNNYKDNNQGQGKKEVKENLLNNIFNQHSSPTTTSFGIKNFQFGSNNIKNTNIKFNGFSTNSNMLSIGKINSVENGKKENLFGSFGKMKENN